MILITVCVIVVGGGYLYQREQLANFDAAQSTAIDTSPQPALPEDAITFDIGGKNFVMKESAAVIAGLDEPGKAFVAAFTEAMNNKDLNAFKGLMHPESIACIDKVNSIFRDEHYKKLMAYEVPAAYLLAFEAHKQVFDAGFTAASEQWFKDPVEHTHTFILHYQGGPNGSETIMHRILKEGDSYKIVLGCPTERTVDEFVKNYEISRKAESRANEIYPQLKDPLKSELKKLLKEGRFPEAMQKYSEKSKEEAATVSEVLRRLGNELREEMIKEMEAKRAAAPAPAEGAPAPASPSPGTPAKPGAEPFKKP